MGHPVHGKRTLKHTRVRLSGGSRHGKRTLKHTHEKNKEYFKS